MEVRIEAHRLFETQMIHKHSIDVAAFSCYCRIPLYNANTEPVPHRLIVSYMNFMF